MGQRARRGPLLAERTQAATAASNSVVANRIGISRRSQPAVAVPISGHGEGEGLPLGEISERKDIARRRAAAALQKIAPISLRLVRPVPIADHAESGGRVIDDLRR